MESRGVGTSLERQLRVIVLDASPTTRKILEVILRREGHQVVCFDDPLEALRFLSRHGPADLLFLGMDLPKMDGFDVLKYLKGEARYRPMVSIALLGEQDGVLSRVKARLAGAQQVVMKPLVRQQIVALVSGYSLAFLTRRRTGEHHALAMVVARRSRVEEAMRTMGQSWEAACELAPEEADRIPWLRRRLLAWFERSGRSFPWREPDRAPYEVVVAEILLQRTTAAGVARAYPGFVDRYPSWASLVQASPEELENALRPLGLWRQKALAFQQLALAIEGRGGVVPRARKELEGLPGIGPYTASAVLAIVYGRAEPLLDVNMARLLSRFLGLSQGDRASPRRVLHVRALRLVRGKHCLVVNWAVLDFGALVCRARNPLCPGCPLRSRCQYARPPGFQLTPSASVLSSSRNAGGR